MNHFKKQQIQNIADFNPREQLAKGALAKSVPMAMLKEFQRQITGYEIKVFNGGAKFRNGDTLLAKITPCLENGKTAFVDILDDGEVAFGSTEFIVLRAKNETNPEFLYYFAISPDFRKRAIECMEGTSGRQRVNENTLKILELPIPEPQTQQSIAAILSSLDKKIALNKQINARLEQMAKTLYDYWFVQFDFPDANGKPYKSSGGDMVFDETLKREIPKGWEVVTLKDFLTIKNGKDHKPLSDGKYTVYGSGGAIRCVDDYLFEGESVLIPRKGTLNNVMYIDEAFWTVDTMFYTEMKQDFFAKYVFYSIKDIDFTKFNLGTGVPSMTSSILYSLKIIKPSNCSLKHFEDVLKPIFLKIANNEKQNHHLTQLRDFLLPMLMNGQVSVAE